MGESVMLTDDEVVALATTVGETWPGGLPTVSSDLESMAEAEFRGNRSLFARQLIGDDAVGHSEERRLWDDALSATGRVFVYLGDDQYRRANWGLSSTHYVADGDWVLETLSPVGIHRLSRVPLDDHKAFFAALFEGALTAGPAGNVGPGEPVAICMLGQGSKAAVLLAVGADKARAGDVVVAEGHPVPISELEEVGTSDAAIDLLIEAVLLS